VLGFAHFEDSDGDHPEDHEDRDELTGRERLPDGCPTISGQMS
jgi:hypothetical protein